MAQDRSIHLGERDCSVQRRYQKLIEEITGARIARTPASRVCTRPPCASPRACHYRGAGTVEFLVDVQRDEFYFLEMNARIQVEHPVTEAVTGVDLVAEQIAIAAGDGLRLDAVAISDASGCAIECRVNAEDPARDFAPEPGARQRQRDGRPARASASIRTSRRARRVPPFYDSLLGKIIAHGPDRAHGTARGCATRSPSTRIDGVATNLRLPRRCARPTPDFARGGVDTGSGAPAGARTRRARRA